MSPVVAQCVVSPDEYLERASWCSLLSRIPKPRQACNLWGLKALTTRQEGQGASLPKMTVT